MLLDTLVIPEYTALQNAVRVISPDPRKQSPAYTRKHLSYRVEAIRQEVTGFSVRRGPLVLKNLSQSFHPCTGTGRSSGTKAPRPEDRLHPGHRIRVHRHRLTHHPGESESHGTR